MSNAFLKIGNLVIFAMPGLATKKKYHVNFI